MSNTAIGILFEGFEESEEIDSGAGDPCDRKLEDIRRVSNIIQALENLIVQCEDNEIYAPIREFGDKTLVSLQAQLRHLIHR